jgi:hypothetical protein
LFLGKAFKLPFSQALESELTPERNFTEGEFQIVDKENFKGLSPSITPLYIDDGFGRLARFLSTCPCLK